MSIDNTLTISAECHSIACSYFLVVEHALNSMLGKKYVWLN